MTKFDFSLLEIGDEVIVNLNGEQHGSKAKIIDFGLLSYVYSSGHYIAKDWVVVRLGNGEKVTVSYDCLKFWDRAEFCWRCHVKKQNGRIMMSCGECRKKGERSFLVEVAKDIYFCPKCGGKEEAFKDCSGNSFRRPVSGERISFPIFP